MQGRDRATFFYFTNNCIAISPRNNTRIQYNRISSNNLPGGASGNGVYTDWPVVGLNIVDNLFEDQDNNAIIIIGYDSISTDITISRNEVTGNGIGDGFSIVDSMGKIEISNNRLSGLRNGISFGGTGTFWSTDTIEISNNFIVHSVKGIYTETGTDITGKEIHINYNNLSATDSFFVLHQGTGTLDARCNWLSGTDSDSIATKMSGDIDYEPFLVNDTDIDTNTIGFQPAANSCADSLATAISYFPAFVKRFHFTVYPNPVSDAATITWSGVKGCGKETLIVYDLTGRPLMSCSLSNESRFYTSGQRFSPGLYFFRIFADTEFLGAGKFIIL